MVLYDSIFNRCRPIWWRKWKEEEGSPWIAVAEESVSTRQWTVRVLLLSSLICNCLVLTPALLRIRYLPEDQRAQVQDFRNWVQSDPDLATRSALESPIIRLIENFDATTYHEPGTFGTPKELAPEAEKTSPTTELLPPPARGANTAGSGSGKAGTSGREARGSGKCTIQVVPFQSLHESTQEELGKELFDDPLLIMENMQKLVDSMQWSFKFTKVSLLLSSLSQ